MEELVIIRDAQLIQKLTDKIDAQKAVIAQLRTDNTQLDAQARDVRAFLPSLLQQLADKKTELFEKENVIKALLQRIVELESVQP